MFFLFQICYRIKNSFGKFQNAINNLDSSPRDLNFSIEMNYFWVEHIRDYKAVKT